MGNKRIAEIKTPLGDKLLLRGAQGKEELGRPFAYQIELLSEDDAIDAAQVVGKGMAIVLQLEKEGQKRHVHGIVTSFTDAGRLGGYAVYHAELRPFIWLLSHTSDCRVFQKESVPDIIKKVLRDHGYTDVEDKLTEQYKAQRYVVQYRESALNFITRLMERAGIYYYFEHEESKHTLVLADSGTAHKTASGYETVPYYPPTASGRRESDHFYDWRAQRHFRAGKFTVNSYDYKKPKADLKAKSNKPREHDKSDFEFYDFTGTHFEPDVAERVAKLHLQAQQARYELLRLEGSARGLNAGHKFSLSKAKRSSVNKEYFIISVDLKLALADYETGTGSVARESSYMSKLTAVDSKTDFRLPIVTPKPAIFGAQTAVVTGKKGEDVWTDEHGRIKIKFHWDREGKDDESSSCWVRVAQHWAGGGFGSLFIPRVGQEVVVTFLDGDPDRPLVTGGVYNGDNKPPFDLPNNATQSGIKTRSTRGGRADQNHEIRIDDRKGEEELFIHAQRDVKHVVERDVHTEIKRDHSLKIGGSQKVVVEAGHDLNGVSGAKLQIKGACEVDSTQTIELSGPISITLKCGETSSIKLEPQMITVMVGGCTLVVTPAGVVMSPSAAVGNRPI